MGKAVLFINVGDHAKVWSQLIKEVPQMKPFVHEHFEDFAKTDKFCNDAYDGNIKGIHAQVLFKV
jgi:hypothetical protein